MDSSQSSSQKASSSAAQKPLAAMIYICGECNGENEIRTKDQIRCRECGHRVLYKKRTRNLIVYDAR
ncbi:DNA-directed RNA polymerases I, II, and III subunit RPABC4 [Aphelenchoides besseyi]|nr:DNA-directed RNA polymerases I, II, and III subunit RPABC4 [Aphelenchoides besseyi]KAI6208695.1 DNA-directed RNA polymerases I, II, and III subunit RPABC4 [Aphelenchoides besseyi]